MVDCWFWSELNVTDLQKLNLKTGDTGLCKNKTQKSWILFRYITDILPF